MHPFRYAVSFRVVHPTMDPDEICGQLNLQAKPKWKAGSQRRTPRGDPLTGIYDVTYCCFRFEHPKNVGLVNFLKRCTKKLRNHREFLNHIHSTGGSLEYFIGWFSDKNSGGEFDWQLLSQLADLKITLSIDFYGGPELGSGTPRAKKG